MNAMGSTVTVLGGNGYVGRHLSAHLHEIGHNCWVPQRADSELLKRPLGTVFYCIGLTADFRSRPFDTVDAHVGVLKEVLQHGQFDQLIYVSSTRVYLGATGTDENHTLVVNTRDPDDLYKLSKLMGEGLALHSGRACKVARLSNVVGGDEGNPDSFVYGLLRDARSGSVLLRSALESAKDYVHIDDVVRLLTRIAQSGQHQIYNVASGEQVTHGQWVDHLVAITRCSVQVLENAPVARFAPVDITRIRAEFGFAPRPVLAAMNL